MLLTALSPRSSSLENAVYEVRILKVTFPKEIIISERVATHLSGPFSSNPPR